MDINRGSQKRVYVEKSLLVWLFDLMGVLALARQLAVAVLL